MNGDEEGGGGGEGKKGHWRWLGKDKSATRESVSGSTTTHHL